MNIENPGSFNEMQQANPELSYEEIFALYTAALGVYRLAVQSGSDE